VERRETGLPGVWLLEPRVLSDHRGFFLESYNRRTLADLGITTEFVQDNHARSGRGVLRGLHYQLGHAQAKLVRVTVGRVFDVVVDVRRGSPTFGRWFGAELSSESFLQLFVPEGFAHGYLVLSEVAEFQYKCSDFYAPEDERGVLWNDPAIGIRWPQQDVRPVLSDKDAALPVLADIADHDLPEHGP
jgi:dTDP-4-dehydrorhamnose 3,5-epimerase